MSNTIDEVVCLIPSSNMTDLTGRLWNYRNNGGISFYETGGVFDQPYIKFTDGTMFKNYLYTRTVENGNDDFLLGEDFTIEFYIRNITTPSKTWSHLICYHPDNATNSGWSIAYNNTDKCIFFINPTYGTYTAKTTTLITAMTDWTHIAFVKKGKKIATFVNGNRQTLVDNQPNTYMVDTNIKDGLYIGRANSSYTGDEHPKCDFGGLKISKYARYDVSLSTIEIKDFVLDNPNKNYNTVHKRNDKFNLYNEGWDGVSNYGYKGMVWKNYKDGINYYNINNPNYWNYNYYKYNPNDRSNIMSINGSPCGYVMFNQFGNIINNIDQDYTIFWDVYFDERWCDLTKTPKCYKFNYVWETGFGTSQIILYYGRDSASVDRSFFTFGDGGLLNAEPVEANRKYLDFKFEPNVKYKFTISQKNHKRYYYINGNLFASRDISELFMVYGANLYGNSSNTELSTTAYNTEYELCEKIDNIFIKVGDAFSSDFYDYNNDEYDYDWNMEQDKNHYGEIGVFNITDELKPSLFLATQYKPVQLYTQRDVKSNINSKSYIVKDPSDSRSFRSYNVFLEGKADNKVDDVKIIDSLNYNVDYQVKTSKPLFNVVSYDNKKDLKFINRDELIVQDKNINVVLGYLTGEVEQSACKTNALYIKVFNNRTNRHIGDYEIIEGEFKIDNLNYYDTYDVVLVDRLGKIENQVMSRRKPTPYIIEDLIKKYSPTNYNGEIVNIDIFVELAELMIIKSTGNIIKDSLYSKFDTINNINYYFPELSIINGYVDISLINSDKVIGENFLFTKAIYNDEERHTNIFYELYFSERFDSSFSSRWNVNHTPSISNGIYTCNIQNMAEYLLPKNTFKKDTVLEFEISTQRTYSSTTRSLINVHFGCEKWGNNYSSSVADRKGYYFRLDNDNTGNNNTGIGTPNGRPNGNISFIENNPTSWHNVKIHFKSKTIIDVYYDNVLKFINVPIEISGDYIYIWGDAGNQGGLIRHLRVYNGFDINKKSYLINTTFTNKINDNSGVKWIPYGNLIPDDTGLIRFDGNSYYYSDSLSLYNKNFKIKLKFKANNKNLVLFDMYTNSINGSWQIYTDENGHIMIWVYGNSTHPISSNQIIVNEWNTVEITRTGDKLEFILNGIVTTFNDFNKNLLSFQYMTIGHQYYNNNNSYNVNGYFEYITFEVF